MNCGPPLGSLGSIVWTLSLYFFLGMLSGAVVIGFVGVVVKLGYEAFRALKGE